MKLIYTRPEDGGVSIVVAAPKEAVERVLGPLTQQEYEDHVIETSIPENALRVKRITDEDLPADRELRAAWVDVTDDTKINIDVKKARDLKLQQLREERGAKLVEMDSQALRALEAGDDLTAIKAKKKALRDVTEPLKALDVAGKVDDAELLAEIKRLSALPADL